MRIGELATKCGVSVRALRYYEEQLLLAPQRTSSGHRVYSAEHENLVARIRELFDAGFCSAVIRDLLPALSQPDKSSNQLVTAFEAARVRLESEKQAIDHELAALQQLYDEIGLAPDAHVSMEDERHDSSSASTATPFDHRDRRLR